MEEKHIIKKVDSDRWKQAQEFELTFARATIDSDDDWNKWWYEKFERYSIISGRAFPNVLEVGCGPHTNIRYILPLIRTEKIWLEDPLIQYYITYNLTESKSWIQYLKKIVKRSKTNYILQLFANLTRKVDISSSKLEDLPYRDGQMDLIVCINVLDHVSDYDRCMAEMFRVLKTDGVLILGQDLSDEEDRILCPESYTDIGHPIKTDLPLIEQSLEGKYRALFRKILPRNEGRNPRAHYGTYLGILQKNAE